jgi:uncharacterized protein
MTIDTHTHLGNFPSVEPLADELSTRTGVAGWRTKYPEIYDRVKVERPVDNAESLLAAMDANDVDISIVQPTVGVPNDEVAKWAAPHDRLVPLAWAASFSWVGRWAEDPDPALVRENSERAAATARDALRGGAFAGIGETCARDLTQEVDPVKIARDLTPLFEELKAAGGRPIQFPTGWTQFPGNLFYQDPLWVDEIAGRFPDVPIILTKMGRGIQRFFDSAISVALRNKNVHFDMLATTPEHLKVAIDLIGADRIMFATDWSYTWRYLSSPFDVHASARSILEHATIDEGARQAILDSTARKLFQV